MITTIMVFIMAVIASIFFFIADQIFSFFVQLLLDIGN
ncbi:hypothetical protein IMCC14465_17130 [alpha proteobacterium IMCC14465]|uniref:Preprotein translocase subunit SecE n=1 Tax=alpha proteobacterium IMCC14465 TaxID=1220535 RepID=J9DU66_9PROT|nr:hypothetical protein IMCC14465_17130 [alpha proteobacterium IMCC14465]